MLTPPRTSLGELEAGVLSILWSSGEPLAVRDVLARINRQRPALAYTTVLTVLDRLYDKGLVTREKEGKAFLYRAAVSRDTWLGEQAAHVLTGTEGPPNSAALMAFLDSAERADPALLERLSTLIEARRTGRKT